jgi:hypothetical protein
MPRARNPRRGPSGERAFPCGALQKRDPPGLTRLALLGPLFPRIFRLFPASPPHSTRRWAQKGGKCHKAGPPRRGADRPPLKWPGSLPGLRGIVPPGQDPGLASLKPNTLAHRGDRPIAPFKVPVFKRAGPGCRTLGMPVSVNRKRFGNTWLGDAWRGDAWLRDTQEFITFFDVTRHILYGQASCRNFGPFGSLLETWKFVLQRIFIPKVICWIYHYLMHWFSK